MYPREPQERRLRLCQFGSECQLPDHSPEPLERPYHSPEPLERPCQPHDDDVAEPLERPYQPESEAQSAGAAGAAEPEYDAAEPVGRLGGK